MSSIPARIFFTLIHQSQIIPFDRAWFRPQWYSTDSCTKVHKSVRQLLRTSPPVHFRPLIDHYHHCHTAGAISFIISHHCPFITCYPARSADHSFRPRKLYNLIPRYIKQLYCPTPSKRFLLHSITQTSRQNRCLL